MTNLNTLQIRGKDLVGGVKVMPMGLDAAIKKRTSGEFKMEVNNLIYFTQITVTACKRKDDILTLLKPDI